MRSRAKRPRRLLRYSIVQPTCRDTSVFRAPSLIKSSARARRLICLGVLGSLESARSRTLSWCCRTTGLARGWTGSLDLSTLRPGRRPGSPASPSSQKRRRSILTCVWVNPVRREISTPVSRRSMRRIARALRRILCGSERSDERRSIVARSLSFNRMGRLL